VVIGSPGQVTQIKPGALQAPIVLPCGASPSMLLTPELDVVFPAHADVPSSKQTGTWSIHITVHTQGC
jgi:hypothetical protein